MRERLSELVAGEFPEIVDVPDGWGDIWIEGITSDSRKVREGYVFVAIRGTKVDGHRFIEPAIRAGAAAVLYEAGVELGAYEEVPCIGVADPRVALARGFARLEGPLPEPMNRGIVGLTGTNGKTSTTYMLESILKASGARPGVMGTVNYRVVEQLQDSPLTTPGPDVFWNTLRWMLKHGASHLLMEISSHALDQHRVDGVPFAVVGFTNLTQDHLDYHGDFDAYFEAKARLFSELVCETGRAVINGDDPVWERLAARSRAPVWTYSTRPDADADIKVLHSDIGIHGIRAEVHTPEGVLQIESPLLGAFHLHNALLACGVALALGVEGPKIVEGLAALPAIPGRLERVSHPSSPPFQVLVDYAHTPDALEQILKSLRPLCSGRLITVFGCGGDRDQSKRPIMGRVVAHGSDICLVTSDNPRTEDPQTIVDQILAGMEGQPAIDPQREPLAPRGVWSDIARTQAIAQAVEMARAGDVVLIAGKGHEDYQIIGERRFPFSDRAKAREALDALAKGT